MTRGKYGRLPSVIASLLKWSFSLHSVDLKKKELSLTLLMPALELLGMYTTESIDNHEATENTILTISISKFLLNPTRDHPSPNLEISSNREFGGQIPGTR